MSKSIQLKNINNEKMYPHPYFPVGSIYLSVVNINPTKWFGGTWELISQGRTLVGVDTNDADFNTVKKTGGAKTHLHSTGNCTLTVEQIPTHRHDGSYGYFSDIQISNRGDGGGGWNTVNISQVDWNQTGAYTYLYTGNTGGGKAHNHGNTGSPSNIQPYFTCYIWCRTA